MGRWESVHRNYLHMVGDTPRGRSEAWDHLSEAHRMVLAMLPDPERSKIDPSVTVTANADFATIASIDFRVYAIQDVFNVTEGIAMHPEPGGMMGRNVFLDTTGKPPVGSMTHYQRDGVNLYVRNIRATETVLRIRAFQQPADVTSASLSSDPIPPQQYDRAIAHKAAELYYLVHAAENSLSGADGRTTLLSDKHMRAFASLLPQPSPARVEEDKNRTERFVVAGYRMGR